MMKIGLCCNDKYAMACGVCMLSVLETNDYEIEFVILCDKVSEDSKNKLIRTAESHGAKVRLIDVLENLFAGLKVSPLFPRSIYFRYLFPSLLPNESKLLYLDCDTIVRGTLSELWETDLTGYACGVVQDQHSDDIRHYNRLQIPKDSRYFNSGVILFNLDYWRENNIMNKCIRYVSENPSECIYPDQDALNVILLGLVQHLSFKYNCQGALFVDDYNLMLDRTVWDDVHESKRNPIICHFTASIKPWHRECVHIYHHEWIDIMKRSEWRSYKRKPLSKLRWWYHVLRRSASSIKRASGLFNT